MKTLGESILEAREASGLLPSVVADLLGLPPEEYDRIERNERPIHVDKLVLIQQRLGPAAGDLKGSGHFSTRNGMVYPTMEQYQEAEHEPLQP